jgi:hypothetical protein
VNCRKEIKTEYKKKFRPFSQYDYVEGKFLKKTDANIPEVMSELPQTDSWYREVLELRRKAGEYKVNEKARIPYTIRFRIIKKSRCILVGGN